MSEYATEKDSVKSNQQNRKLRSVGDVIKGLRESKEKLTSEDALTLIRSGEYSHLKQFINKIDRFTNLNSDVAIALIKAGEAYWLANNFEKFTGISESEHNYIALKIIEAGNAEELAYNLKKVNEWFHGSLTLNYEIIILYSQSLFKCSPFTKLSGKST